MRARLCRLLRCLEQYAAPSGVIPRGRYRGVQRSLHVIRVACEKRLLDAAHINSDKNERLGQPVVINGLPLSKIHHAAFDAHLIGITPNYRLIVFEQSAEKSQTIIFTGVSVYVML